MIFILCDCGGLEIITFYEFACIFTVHDSLIFVSFFSSVLGVGCQVVLSSGLGIENLFYVLIHW